MKEYLRDVLEYLTEEIIVRVKALAATHLFEVQRGEDQVLLDEHQARVLHHYFVQLLFTSKRYRKDIRKTVALPTKQVKAPGEDDWNKLRCLLQYVKCTMWSPLVLSAHKLNFVKWWVDSSYVAHNDRRRNTGATMYM